MSATLCRWRREAVALPVLMADLATLAGADPSILLLSEPRAFRLARLGRGGAATGPADKPIDVAAVFELRAIGPVWEARWLRDAADPDGTGVAVLLSEKGLTLDSVAWQPLRMLEARAVIDGTYLVAGKLTPHEQDLGWSVSHAGRLRPFDLPVPATGGVRAEVMVREYVCVEPEHGNAYVAEERLIELRVKPESVRNRAAGEEVGGGMPMKQTSDRRG